MKITTKGYNIPTITDIGEFTSGTPKEVGTPKEFNQIMSMISKSGLCYGEFTLGGVALKGYGICNPYNSSGMEIIITTNCGNELQIITGLYYVSGGKSYMEFTKNSIT